MKGSKKFLFVALVALVAISLLVTGCGKKDEGTSETTTVTIGVGVPLTQGAVAFGPGVVNGAKLAVAQANESQEVKDLGITFVVKEGDDQSDPKTGVNVANQFVADASLIGVVGHFNSGVSIPSSKVYNDASIAMISPGSTNPTLTQQGFNNVFRTCTTDAVQGPSGAESAFALGLKKAFVVDDSTPYGEGLADEFAKKFEELGGTVLGREKTSDKDSDFAALVTAIKAAGPDVIYYGGVYNSGALLSKQAKDAGLTVPVMGGDGLVGQEYIDLAGAGAEGDLATSVGYPLDLLPGGQAFKAAYEEMFPGVNIANFDAYGYDAAQAIIKAAIAVAKADGAASLVTPSGRAAIVAAVAASNFEGATGPVAFDEFGDTTNKVITLYKVVDGAWVAQQ